MELSRDLGHRPIILIRFNPDSYLHNGKKVTSCWHTNRQGICVVKKVKQDDWKERLDTLKSQIDYWRNNVTDKTVESVELYYDYSD